MRPLADGLPPFYGQWSPPVDEVISRNYFPDQREGVFVECGAGDGIADSTCRHFEERGWRGYNLEPVPAIFKQLRQNRPSPRVENRPVGLSSAMQVEIFDTLTLPHGGPCVGGVAHSAWTPEFERDVAKKGLVRGRAAVELVRYDVEICERVDLLVLDVEGSELKAVAGMTHSDYLPEVVCAEYPIVGLLPLSVALEQLGYRFDFVAVNNAFFSRRTAAPPSGWGRTDVWRW